MSLKTENLAIVLTDIAGYTETTQNQSRLDNARLLATHNRILYPIIKRYKGRHVKSIGDALLLVFRSPTDAMLCAMAMQDALFEFNRNTPKEQQIHIRVAASLGEVRVTRNDVFGEAVNVTSRIESITPVDEVYLSEAVYMAMNKAEVPSQEVGRRELKGISGPIRIFNIPRFSTPRLVPQDVMAAEDMSDLVYPYGGAHLAATDGGGGWRARFGETGNAGRAAKVMLASLVLLPLSLLAVYYGPALFTGKYSAKPAATENVASAPAVEAPRYQPEFKSIETEPVAKPETKPAASVAPDTKTAVKSAAAPPPRQFQQEFKLSGSEAGKPGVASSPYARISDARRALKENKLGRDEYKRVVARLETAMKTEIDQAKSDYKADRITRKEYRDRVGLIEKKYK
jgi:class 3 adenylate cyclase